LFWWQTIAYDFQAETPALCLIQHGGCKIQSPAVSGMALLTLVITAAVGFDEDSLRCVGEFEHSCKQHSSKPTAGGIHTAQLHTWSIKVRSEQ